MPDKPEDNAAETPMQRALRLKQAALDTKRQPPRGGNLQRAHAGMPAGQSKPWMKK